MPEQCDNKLRLVITRDGLLRTRPPAQVIHDGDELLPLLEFTAANGASLQSEVEVGVSHCP